MATVDTGQETTVPPMRQIQKTGYQSADDPLKFIMSTSAVDRAGDIVEQDFDLRAFKNNNIALFNHNPNFPIGTWHDVKIEAGRLVGRLKLAAAGTSKMVDEIRSLVEQRILKAVSIGFIPSEAEPLKTGGYRYRKNQITECSLVAVGMNSQALLTRSAAISPELQKMMQDSVGAEGLNHSTKRKSKMSIQDQIEQQRAQKEDVNAEIEKLKSVADTELRDMTDDEIGAYDELLAKREEKLRSQGKDPRAKKKTRRKRG
jgi:hypothetical protein